MPAYPDITLVLLPGLDGSGLLFQPLRATLPAGLKTVVVRYPDRPATLAELAAHVAELLPRHSPCVLLAESFSGPVAIELLQARPAGVIGVIFCATCAGFPSPLRWLLRWLPAEALLRRPAPSFFIRRFCLGREASEEHLRLFRQAVAGTSAPVLAQRLQLLARMDYTNKLAAIDLPACYLQTTRDRLVPPRCVESFLAKLPRCMLREIDAPHFVLQARPRAAWAAMEEFLISLKPC